MEEERGTAQRRSEVTTSSTEVRAWLATPRLGFEAGIALASLRRREMKLAAAAFLTQLTLASASEVPLTCESLIGRKDARKDWLAAGLDRSTWCYELSSVDYNCADFFTTPNTNPGKNRLCFTPASGEKRSPCSERHLLRKTTSLHTP